MRLALLTESASRARHCCQLQDDLRADARALHTEARMKLAERDASVRLCIVVDQFENCSLSVGMIRNAARFSTICYTLRPSCRAKSSLLSPCVPISMRV